MHAVLYDVHGNLPALDAVLADAQAAGATEFVLGGDYALFGPYPVETVERLRAVPRAAWIRGNGERWTADPGDAPDDEVVQGAIAYAREALGAKLVEELAALDLTRAEGTTLFSHASPVSDVRSFLPEPAADEHELLGDGAAADRLVFGHTHIQFRRFRPTGTELLNPGSVGMPFDGDTRAAYALIGDDGEIETRRVAYDHQASAAAARERLPAFGETIARRIERAAFAG
jgi:diadenosine tetraphosphatase ApaH/serine/threonine PP2A family protein phosphatase